MATSRGRMGMSRGWIVRSQKGGYGLEAFVKTIDTILWGRKTYAKGIEFGMTAAGFGPKMKH